MQNARFRVWDLGCKMQDLGFRVWDLGCRMQDFGFRARDFSFLQSSRNPSKPKKQQAPWFGVFWGKGAYCRKGDSRST